MRGAIYYDAFNLYHAIDDLGQPHLKWCNLMRLGQLIARGHASSIDKAVFCTARFPGNPGKQARYHAYIKALEMVGVQIKFGHTTKEPISCKSCSHTWDQPREKETDINLSLSIFEDAMDDVFDIALLVTADTDQAATINALKRRFPHKKIMNVIPPKRHPSAHLASLCDKKFQLTARHLDDCTLPDILQKDGYKTLYRPIEYAPPQGWVHPDNRPKS